MKQVFVLIHILLLTVAVVQGVTLVRKAFAPPPVFTARPQPDPAEPDGGGARNIRGMPDIEKYDMISRRNLFDVQVRSFESENMPSLSDVPAATPPEQGLPLALWGTVITGSGAGNYAVIEHKTDQVQSLLQTGDRVEGATVKQIERSRVILDIDGREQVLEVDITQIPAAVPGPEPVAPAPFSQKSLDMPAGEGFPGLVPAPVVNQVRFRPFFTQGRPEGLLVYGIRKDSPFHQLGLRNGDIVQAVNDSPTLSGKEIRQVYQFLEQFEQTPFDIDFTVLRRGEPENIMYRARDNTDTVDPVTENAAPEEKP
jgi:general secretion pathway protein C